MSVETNKVKSPQRSWFRTLEEQYPADPELTAKTRARVERVVERLLPMSSSVLSSVFASVSLRVFSTVLPTWATALGADRQPVFIINPEFTDQVDTDDGLSFVAAHEAFHAILQHIDPQHDEGLSPRSLQNLRLAQDAMINHLLVDLGFRMPTIDGKVVGIEPRSFYRWVRGKADEHNIACPDETGFFKDERTIFDLLEQIPADPNRRQGSKTNWCQNGSGEKIPGPGGGMVDLPSDPDATGSLVEEALEVAVNDALQNGSAAAKKEIEALLDITENSEVAQKIWGTIGAHAVRGTVPEKTQSKDWYKWTASWVGHRLAQVRSRWQYNRKVPWDPRIGRKGRGRRKVGVVGIDTSGSMPQEWIDSFVGRLGKAFPDLELVAVAWDAEAQPLELGTDVHGGGGTVFECFDTWVAENLRYDPDFILTVTDGYFSPPAPRIDPNLYGWIIIPGGRAFMKNPYVAADGTPVPAMRVFELESFDL